MTDYSYSFSSSQTVVGPDSDGRLTTSTTLTGTIVGDEVLVGRDPNRLRWTKTYEYGSRGDAMGSSSNGTGYSIAYAPSAIGVSGATYMFESIAWRAYRIKTAPTASLKGTSPNRYGRWTNGDDETLFATISYPKSDVFGCPIAIPCGSIPSDSQWGFLVQPTHICSGFGFSSTDFSTNINPNAEMCDARIQQTNDTYEQNVNGGPVDDRWMAMNNNTGGSAPTLIMRQSTGEVFTFDKSSTTPVRRALSGTFTAYISTENSAVADPVINVLFQCVTLSGVVTAATVATTKTVEAQGEGTAINISALKYTCSYDFSATALPAGTVSYYLAMSYTNGSKIYRIASYIDGIDVFGGSLPVSPVPIRTQIPVPPPPCFTSDMLPGSVAIPGMIWKIPT